MEKFLDLLLTTFEKVMLAPIEIVALAPTNLLRKTALVVAILCSLPLIISVPTIIIIAYEVLVLSGALIFLKWETKKATTVGKLQEFRQDSP